jgi:cephalosporin-C deacetylase-like acetyl esterase
VPDTYTLPSGEVIRPIDVVFEEERANLNKILGRMFPVGTCGLLVGVLEAEEDGIVIYGAGADWWWTCYVNGEMVFGRPRSKCANGNSRGTFLKTDWVFPIRVRKGVNTIAFHLASGTFWSIGTGVLPIAEGQDTCAEFKVQSSKLKVEGSDKPQIADLQLIGNTTRNPLSYHVGEEMEFVFSIKDPRAVSAGRPLFLVWNRRGDDGVLASGCEQISLEKPACVRTSISRPGFVHMLASVTSIPTPSDASQLLQFEGGAGADIASLKPAAKCPEDFDAFWAKQRALLDAVPVESEVRPWLGTCFPDGVKIPESLAISLVKVACAGDHPVTAFLAVPKAEGKYPVRIVFDGYSKEPKLSHRLMTEGMITLHVNAHGYDLFRDPAYYDAFFAPYERDVPAYGMSPKENSDPETAYFRGMALRVMRAFDFAKTLHGWNGRDLIATGGSQGGLQAIWAASLVPGITRCETYITWCSNMAGAALDKRLPGWHPEYVRGLDYYDTVFHAARIPTSCFVDFERIGLGDYTCPPSGVTIVYNAVRGPKRAAYYQNSTHPYVPPEPEKFMRFAQTELRR